MKVSCLPSKRSEKWERWGTFPLGQDPHSLTSMYLGTSFLGHFMGKKSLESPRAFPLGTTPHTSLRDQRLQLSHDLLRILQIKKALSMSFSSPAPQTQEAAGADTAEVMPVMGQTQHGLDCAHPGKLLNGTLVVAPSGCKS
ncbi:Hypothetical predicted protein [Marmota monax]|uniref:Neuromedin-B n=1 Tax=Marmota monax TaxID=9995 RepID=A0A5E4BWI8_MARMO|nr:neuromedin-B [Marmota monax]VTJ73616.1 Hypothetical predicted protein [Marmota monax]